jgi:outer membrane receptor protein involved in Fe transport
MLKGNLTKSWQPFDDLGATIRAARADRSVRRRAGRPVDARHRHARTNQVQLGTRLRFQERNLTSWSHHWRAATASTPARRASLHRLLDCRQRQLSAVPAAGRLVRADDYNLSYDAKGRHDLKAGGEFLWDKKVSFNCANCMGIIDARGGAIPANIEALFPDPWNADTWNLAAISPIVRTYTIGVGQNKLPFDQPKTAAWVQDDWHLTTKLTLNIGARYDLIWDPFANWVALEPWMKANRPQDADNIQPRLGFAYSLNDKTVIRGGSASTTAMSSRATGRCQADRCR